MTPARLIRQRGYPLWRIEPAETGEPLLHTSSLAEATRWCRLHRVTVVEAVPPEVKL